MTQPTYAVGDQFNIQFAWRLPEENYLRAVFEAEILELVPQAEKYLIQLKRLAAGRQDDRDGKPVLAAAYSREYWTLVVGLVGSKIAVAYEAADGRALPMRLATLTGEHDFFARFDRAQKAAREALTAAQKSGTEADDSAI